VLAGVALEHDGLDPRALQQQGKGQTGRPRSNDADLRPHGRILIWPG
jgi:hypothetical protein